MSDEMHATIIASRVDALNEALADAKRAGLRVRIASVVEKDYDHTDCVKLQDITKSLMPTPDYARHPRGHGWISDKNSRMENDNGE